MVCEPVLPERLFETDDEQDAEKRTAQQKQLFEGALDEGREGGEGEGREEEDENGGRREVQKHGEGEETEKGEEEIAGKDGKDGQGEERRDGDTNPAEGVEGEEEDEDEGEKCTPRDARYSGTGVSSLLRVGDNSTQNHGTLTLDLNFPWSSLLDPLPDEVTPPSLATWAEETPPDSDTPLSLDAYLSLCREHLNMSDGEACFNGQVYKCVEKGGERGRREEELQSLLPPLPPSSGLSLTDHIQCLLNFETVRENGLSFFVEKTRLMFSTRLQMKSFRYTATQTQNLCSIFLVPAHKHWCSLHLSLPLSPPLYIRWSKLVLVW